jgi:hypothetical protein
MGATPKETNLDNLPTITPGSPLVAAALEAMRRPPNPSLPES